MSVCSIREFLEKKTKEELIHYILSHSSAEKAVRKEMIKEEFHQIKFDMPVMQAYTNLSITHGLSEIYVMKIIQNGS